MAYPTKEQVAKEFSKVLRSWLTPEQMTEVIALNREEKSPGICHSHDFCDANMAMLEAICHELGLTEDQFMDQLMKEMNSNAPCGEFNALWNEAWEVAFRTEFKA
jgi:hypothetical protein